MNRSLRTSPVAHGALLSLFSLVLAGALAGCASSGPPPRHVKSADIGKLGPLLPDQPLIIEFQAGDVIPLHVTLEGPFVRSPEGAPPIPLQVTRHFFLRIDKDGMKSSLDGEDFDWKAVKPGQFQAGVGVTAEGVKANITIRTPTPPGLPAQ